MMAEFELREIVAEEVERRREGAHARLDEPTVERVFVLHFIATACVQLAQPSRRDILNITRIPVLVLVQYIYIRVYIYIYILIYTHMAHMYSYLTRIYECKCMCTYRVNWAEASVSESSGIRARRT